MQQIVRGRIVRLARTRRKRPMLREHEFHSLAVGDVVDETAHTRSFVLEVPFGA